ncbi:MAG: HAD-IIB family hydrolase [Pirellulaceae bacterium]
MIFIFSDLDGCLLNKHDYSFEAAIPVLSRIRELKIPLILASSKTVVEMRTLAEEMQLNDAPLICENGGAIYWTNRDVENPDSEVLGSDRPSILATLRELKSQFEFSSFEDLQVEGVMRATDLPIDRARAALQRRSTEPLLWEDADDKIDRFHAELREASLTLTKGGRFWHVAGRTTKGLAMQRVIKQRSDELEGEITTLAIGDSPIDQSMLDVADYPIAIPSPDGVVRVESKAHNGSVATQAGATGWAEAVTKVLDKLAK